jgi:transcriptional regulator with XRE-family HTH domain
MAQITTKRLPTTGVVIRAWRIFRGFSSTELAEKAGVRLGYLSEIEHDRKIRPDEDYLEKLANALHVPLKDILGRRMPLEKREDGKAEEEGKDTGGKEPGGVQLLRRRRSGAEACPPIEEPPPVSESAESTTVGQDIDKELEGISQEECDIVREFLVPQARQLKRLIKSCRGE